jgi:His/Glu/Gln/Arg/opine family amino acid ABC transporter permease subunit
MIPVILSAFREAPPPGWEEGLRYSIWENGGFLWDLWFNLIHAERYKMIFDGLLLTLQIAAFGVLIGIVLGFILALMKLSRFTPFRAVATVYISVIRGIPLVVQLLIWYFVILTAPGIPIILICIITFGVNSGAYVAEIFRAGILSVDKGQTEAGRSVGLSSLQTMRLIILPQAIKNALPSLCNEFIILFKDTAIVGFIGVMDMRRAADHITSRTFNSFIPLITVALIYLAIVLVLTRFLGMLERRLRKSDSR